MPPRVIADSDDESDAGELPSPPLPPPLPPAAQPLQPPALTSASASAPALALGVDRSTLTRSSDQESLATVSTDPVYFQKIYNDQHEAAARERSRNSRSRDPGPPKAKEGSHRTSLVTISETSENEVAKDSHGSSMTSTTEPNVERYQDMFPEEKHQDGAYSRRSRSADDPWVVPSDSQTPQTSNLRNSLTQSKARVFDAPNQVRTNNPDLSDSTDTSLDGQAGAGPRERKRRRLQKQKQHLSLERSGGDDHDPAWEDIGDAAGSVVRREAEKATAFSIPVPGVPRQLGDPFTTPIQNRSVLVHNTAVDATSTGSLKRRNLLPQQQTLYSAGSSGSKTTSDSPRNCSVFISSDGFESLQTARPVERVATKTRECGSLGPGKSSSPDAIAGESFEVVIDYEHDPKYRDEEVDAIQTEQRSSTEQQHDDSVAPLEVAEEVIEEPAPKRRRGRPKKAEIVGKSIKDQALSPDQEVPAHVQEAPKRRRGRPRRQPAEKEESPDQADANTAVSNRQVAVSDDVAGSNDEARQAGYIAEDDGPTARKGRGQKRLREESQQSEGAGIAEPDHQEIISTETRTQICAEESTNTVGPAPIKAKKPAFRVGLSKRLKIAPLLRSVRK